MKTTTKEIAPTAGVNKTGRTRLVTIFRWPLLLALLILPQMVQAQWTATVGAQTDEKGIQALAFLPNEIWIHAGDRITWTFQADETHTVTFLRAAQVRPDFNVGCPGFSSDPAIFDGSTCVTTPAMVTGQTFTVIFPVAGNFKLTCLVHVNMDGRIHVLPVSDPLPHDQAFYDEQAMSRTDELLSHGAKMKPLHVPNSPLGVTAGITDITGTAGGTETVAAVRFSHENIRIRAGQTVEWDNQAPIFPHTITFGQRAGEPSESFPRRNGRSGWGPARHHRFHCRQHPLGVHHRCATRTARATTGTPWRDTFPRHFPEPRNLPLHLRPT